ncbi:hypothetical protein [Pseudoclavibacter soli]|uniref:hypothetical protein n=1 Tax=Pseudoclavibacter soli TaxID=452623 RepID=UPI00042137D5|nr:hypothetical protein [Pseudoclavibacter soli]
MTQKTTTATVEIEATREDGASTGFAAEFTYPENTGFAAISAIEGLKGNEDEVTNLLSEVTPDEIAAEFGVDVTRQSDGAQTHVDVRILLRHEDSDLNSAPDQISQKLADSAQFAHYALREGLLQEPLLQSLAQHEDASVIALLNPPAED